jgi:ABC-type dipeptide/oligopeptide/nickel transport system permease subunit
MSSAAKRLEPVEAVAGADAAAPAGRAVPRLSRWSRSGLAGLAVLALWFFVALAAPWIMPHEIGALGTAGVFEPVSWTHWFGTDYLAATCCRGSSTARATRSASR